MDDTSHTPILGKPKSFFERFDRIQGDPRRTHYCPGCGHGLVSNLIAEAIDDLGIQERTILVNPVGCAVFSYAYFDLGSVVAAHGRAPAVATGIKRARPESIVLCYQGDGDLAAIGSNEILHAANRGENITVFFINNAVYGMTGGQMAPTTLLAQQTTTTPQGRSIHEGFPLKICELLATLDAPVYLERVALADNRSLMKARKAIRKAIQIQMANRGFSLVEILSPCPTRWEMSPVDSLRWIKEVMLATFPSGVLRDRGKNADLNQAYPVPETQNICPHPEEIPRLLTVTDKHETFPPPIPRPTPAKYRYRNPRIIVSGFGGQGSLFLGEVLAEGAMRRGYQVSWLPSYGPEMRGGTAHCHVIVSGDAIDSPLVEQPTVLLALNEPSLTRFEPRVVHGGLIIYDSSLIKTAPSRGDIEAVAIPATAIAVGLADPRVANTVVLGAYLGISRLLSKELVVKLLGEKIADPALRERNLLAISSGIDFVSHDLVHLTRRHRVSSDQ